MTHDYEVLSSGQVHTDDVHGFFSTTPVYETRHTYKCKKCGKIVQPGGWPISFYSEGCKSK